MFTVKKVTRYEIPIVGNRESLNFDGGTKVIDLYTALSKIPQGAHISVDYGAVWATYVHDPIEVEEIREP